MKLWERRILNRKILQFPKGMNPRTKKTFHCMFSLNYYKLVLFFIINRKLEFPVPRMRSFKNISTKNVLKPIIIDNIYIDINTVVWSKVFVQADTLKKHIKKYSKNSRQKEKVCSLCNKTFVKVWHSQRQFDIFHNTKWVHSGLSMNILSTGYKLPVQRGFFTNSAGDLLPTLGFLGGLSNFCNYIFFNVSHDDMEK